MAKGTLNGVLTGKLGNSVFYKVTNSANKEKQGVRQYTATIANPKTTPQATQRMRMKPAINFYRGLADLLDHSWEGVKYGALSRQKFMQMALRADADFAIPFVEKGETRFIPGEYPISLGSVPFAGVRVASDGNIDSDGVLFNSLLAFDFNLSFDEATFGQYSQVLINSSNGLLRDGDEITLIWVTENNEQFIPQHSYLVLDASSTLLAVDVLKAARFFISDDWFICPLSDIVANDDGGYDFSSYASSYAAMGVIISRHPSRTSTTWLRSSSYLLCSADFKARFMSNNALQVATRSYQSSDTDLTSDWLLNQAGGTAATGGSSSGSGGSVNKATVANVNVTYSGQSYSAAVVTPTGSSTGFTLIYTHNQRRYLCKVQGNAIVVQSANNWPTTQMPNPTGIEAATAISMYIPNYTLDTSAIADEPIVENPE